MIRLTWTVTRAPDFSGFRYFVAAGDVFDVGDYADAYGLRHCDIDHRGIDGVHMAAERLAPGEWLEVSHEVEEWEE